MTKLTDKQLAARRENLKKGREKRMANLQNKKEEKPHIEYDLESQGSDSESSSDGDFVISKKKVVEKKNGPKPRTRDDVEYNKTSSKNEIEELKNMVMELAIMQKKNSKSIRKQQGKPSKVLLIPPTQQPAQPPKLGNDTMMDHLRKSLGM